MKKILLLFLTIIISLTPVGCGKKQISEPEELLPYDKYDLDLYLKPFWNGEIMYNETCTFVGKADIAPLLYKATEIISVNSYDLKITYERGKDYYYDEDTNSICLTDDTAIPFWKESEYYPETYKSGSMFNYNGTEHKYIAFSEGATFSRKQVAVTYRHSGKKHINKPTNQGYAFKNTFAKLKKGEETKILFYGDSITVGANASGFLGIEPKADIWTKMVFEKMVQSTNNTVSKYLNTAVGGWTSQSGIDNLKNCVLDYNPDCVFIAFGMNDGNMSADDHMYNIESMVNEIRKSNENVEICLVATMLPNKDVAGFYGNQYTYAEAYRKYVDDCKSKGDNKICYADVTSVHSELLQTKRYYDMTGNNVNHTNDFTTRMYAQTVLQTVMPSGI